MQGTTKSQSFGAYQSVGVLHLACSLLRQTYSRLALSLLNAGIGQAQPLDMGFLSHLMLLLVPHGGKAGPL